MKEIIYCVDNAETIFVNKHMTYVAGDDTVFFFSVAKSKIVPKGIYKYLLSDADGKTYVSEDVSYRWKSKHD